MVTRPSDLFGLMPSSMMAFAREIFGMRPLPAGPKPTSLPIKLVWHRSREADPAHPFLCKQIGLAASDVVPHGSRQAAKRRTTDVLVGRQRPANCDQHPGSTNQCRLNAGAKWNRSVKNCSDPGNCRPFGSQG